MTVVRSLVTKLGFQVDKSGLNTLERAIQSFKSRVVFTSSSIKAFATQALGFLGDVAKSSVDINELARNTKLATSEFVSLRRAAESFRFEPQQFDQAFTTLASLLRDAKSGYGELFDIIRKSRGELNLTAFIDTGDVKGAFLEILKYISSLKDVGDQLAAIRDIFGAGNENGILRLVEAGGEAFLKAAEDNKAYAQSFEQGIPAQKEYLKNVTKLTQQLGELQQAAVNALTPLASIGVDFATKGFKGFSVIGDIVQEQGVGAAASFWTQKIGESVLRLFGGEPLTDVQNKVYQEDAEFYRMLKEYQMNQKPTQAPVTMTNNIEVNVAPGTNEEQAKFLSNSIRVEMESFYDEKNREVISNNPQVE